MATEAGHTTRDPPAAHTFKGHPQPPPDERLQEAKNYLADEDVNRNLGFTWKLAQIEEYIKDLEEKNVPCNKRLLQDVKVMADVQREWMHHYMDAPPYDGDACKPDRNPPISNRFVSKAVKKKLKDEKEAMGLANQTREDHASFTIVRDDHLAFLDKLKKDESENPATIEEATDLMWVESRAYGWALKEPSLIPVWLHPRLGLTDRAIKASEGEPWYRKGTTPHSGVRSRPLPQMLPDYLQAAQDKINSLLEDYASAVTTDEQFEDLQDYLSDFELLSIKKLRKKLQNALEQHAGGSAEEDTKEVKDVKNEIKVAYERWVSSFCKQGIQFVPVSGDKEAVPYIQQPGVFYVSVDELSDQDRARLERIESRANELLSLGVSSLNQNPTERAELLSYLHTIWTPAVTRLMEESAKPRESSESEADFQSRSNLNEVQLSAAVSGLLQQLVDAGALQLKYKRAGEIIPRGPGLVCIPWQPLEPFTLPPTRAIVPEETLKELETNINDGLGGVTKGWPGHLGNEPNEWRRKEIEKDLESLMYPKLRRMRVAYLEMKSRVPSEDHQSYKDLKYQYDRALRKWVNSILPARVQVKMAEPFQPNERPGILYLRDPNATLDFVHSVDAHNALADKIKHEIEQLEQKHPAQLPDNPEDQDLYPLLVNLQYPRLKQMDENRRHLSTRTNPMEVEIREEQEAHKKWRKMYNSWVASIQDEDLEVRIPSSMDDPSGDPSLVYYRGPLPQLDSPDDPPDPIFSVSYVDTSYIAISWYPELAVDKAALAEKLMSHPVLPPAVKKLQNEYLAAKLSTSISSEDLLKRKNELIDAFSEWEMRVRQLARPFALSALPLPDDVQKDQIYISTQLRREADDKVSPAEVKELNTKISKYWQIQLTRLKESRKARLCSERMTEAFINSQEMGFDDFRNAFDEFKGDWLSRGFQIVQVGDGAFSAQDPELKGFIEAREQRTGILKDLNKEKNDFLPPSLSPNQRRDIVYAREKEINNLFQVRQQAQSNAPNSFNESNKTRTLDDPGSPLTLTMEQDSKLLELLRPFFPAPLANAYIRVVGANDKLKTSTGNERKRDEVLQLGAVQSFLSLYEPWIRKLSVKEVTLSLTAGDKPIKCEEDCTIYIPYERDMTVLQEPDTTTHLLSPEFQRIQNVINKLLAARESRSLSIVEEKQLRCMLRAVMPWRMRMHDIELRDFAKKARSEVLNRQDRVEYARQAERWSLEYNDWVDDFASKGVRLQKFMPGEPRPPPSSKIMYLEMEDHTQIVDDSTDTPSLPLHVKHREDMLNGYLRGEGNFNPFQNRCLRRYLRALWKTYGQQILQARLDKFAQRRNLNLQGFEWRKESTRVRAAFLAQRRNSSSAWLYRISKWSPSVQLKFIEFGPEQFRLEPISSAEEKTLTETINDAMTIADNDHEVPPPIERALEEFLPLALKVFKLSSGHPQTPPLSNAEQARVDTLLQPLSSAEILAMEDDINELTKLTASGGTLDPADKTKLQNLYWKQVWNIWGSMNPDVRDSMLQTVKQPDPIGMLLEPMLPGATSPAPPSIDPPTIDEVVRLEITMNELLVSRRNITLSELEKQKLRWLLRPLSPAYLKHLDCEVDNLRWKSARDGLDPNEALKLDAFQSQLNDGFEEWMDGITAFGKLLARFWFNRTVMKNVYMHYWLWNDAMHEVAKSSPANIRQQPLKKTDDEVTTDSKISDEKLRNDHDNIELLKQFAETYEGNYGDRLLLKHMPVDLRVLYDEIQMFRESAGSVALTFDENLRLHLLTEDFVRDHMIWYSSLSLEDVKIFRGNIVDFAAKTERRGVQRAAIELGLNLLATNQEQHRPHDRFRRLPLPPNYQPPQDEVPLWKPLEPWKRPVELDPLHYTKLMREFRRWKDDDYTKARNHVINERPGQLPPPANYNGPFTLQSLHEMQDIATKRQNHLSQVSAKLVEKVEVAPRPLLQRICTLIDEATRLGTNEQHPFKDDVPLTMSDLQLLKDICEPSWTIDAIPYGNQLAGFPDNEPDLSLEMAKFEEFEGDVIDATVVGNDSRSFLPLWDPPPQPRSQTADPNSDEYYIQRPYDKTVTSRTGISLEGEDPRGLIFRINNQRQEKAGKDVKIYQWSSNNVQHYLQAMHDAGRIHFDAVNQRVSKIPPGGHRENKYVVSENDAKNAKYITFNNDKKQYEVQYDNFGTRGPPILQPNKYQHFQRIAFRLGRDIRHLSEIIASDISNAERLQEQAVALNKTLQNMREGNPGHATGTIEPTKGKELSLTKIARELLDHAPEFKQDSGLDANRDIITITEEEAARIIQLQLIEESNNNWEPRFPEDEHVWNWVDNPLPTVQTADGRTVAAGSASGNALDYAPGNAPRMPRQRPDATKPVATRAPPGTKRYFSMRRWPVECQSTAVQTIIKTSWPTLELETDKTKKETTQQAPTVSRAQMRRDAVGPWPREKYTGCGGAPNFPFGETPVQQAIQSMQMVEDLKDTPEFREPSPPAGPINALKRKLATLRIHIDQFALPEIPAEWNPTNVSMAEKTYDVIEKAKRTAGFPTTDEAYYPPAAITQLERNRARDHTVRERRRGEVMMEEGAGKPKRKLSREELRRLQDELKIDPITEQVRPPATTPKTTQSRGGQASLRPRS